MTFAQWQGATPSEQTDGELAVRQLLEALGQDPEREGLKATPTRVFKAFKEFTAGYDVDVAALLTTFDSEGFDQMVVVSGIEFVSLCEHHLLPFSGKAHVAYIPNDRIVGLSKIPRLVLAYAQRLQVQERLTDQIVEALTRHLATPNVAVTITAHHSCMGHRGVKQPNALMTTARMVGAFANTNTRAEFYQNIGGIR